MTESEQDTPARPGSQSPQDQPGGGGNGLLAVAANLSHYHREHEKYYSEAPLTGAIALQRTARTLIALAERWTSAEPAAAPAGSPFAGAPDLNDDRAIETSGVLFMEGGGEPAELTRIKSELQTIAAGSEQTGSWLAAAMEASWTMAEALLSYPRLADLLAERHKIIGNNWQNAFTAQLIARCLRRAVSILEQIDLSPAGCARTSSGHAPPRPACTRRPSSSTTPPTCPQQAPCSPTKTSADGGSSTSESSRSPLPANATALTRTATQPSWRAEPPLVRRLRGGDP
jgi:hypothetical protein